MISSYIRTADYETPTLTHFVNQDRGKTHSRSVSNKHVVKAERVSPGRVPCELVLRDLNKLFLISTGV